ncbi:MAG: TonB-dependent receptor plug domain-containing protein [Opitutales bacterium]
MQKKHSLLRGLRPWITIAGVAVSSGLAAQTAPVADDTAATTGYNEDVYVLSPFEVSVERDAGYVATETLAGTRIRTDLRDVGSAISVVTKEFIQDIGATDNATLLQYTTNAEVAGTRGTYAGLGNATTVDETATLRAPGGAQRVRGLAAADNTRDFFVTDIPWDSYNVDRIDIQRGPNSILFGLGSPAGIVNASLHNAVYNNVGSVEFRTGSYGSTRSSVDVNRMLIDNVLAIRVDGLWNNEKYEQKQAFQEDRRIFGTVRFDPKLFGPSFLTSIKFKFENGNIKANRPRIVPPRDSITPWFKPVAENGMGKYQVDDIYSLGSSPQTANPWLTASVANQQQPIWFIDGATNEQYQIYGGFVNTGARNRDGTIRGPGDNMLGQRYSDVFESLASFSEYSTGSRANLPGNQYGQYRDMSLLDDTVFDFYKNLIDGNTKSEWEDWNAYNFNLTQTGWGDRVGIDLSYDYQRYNRGGDALLNNPTLNIDVMKKFQDFSTNPNFGRAFVQGGPGNGSSYESNRKYLRAALFGEIRASDLFDSEFLVKLIGRHRFTLAFSKEKYAVETRAWQDYAHANEWTAYYTRSDGTTTSFRDRAPTSVIYLGSSLANETTSHGLYLPGISSDVTLRDGSLYSFATTWNASGVAYGDPWTLDPASQLAQMFNLDNADDGTYKSPAPNTQASNPANYIGWNRNTQMNLERNKNGENESLLTSAAKTLRQTKSYAGSWQGFMWNESIIPTVGWRYDEIKGKSVTAQSMSNNRNMLNMQPDVYKLPDEFPDSATFKDHSLTYGAVIHINKLLPKDVLPINVSLSYNDSSNFQVTNTRRDIYGNTIGNPTGDTKEIGLLLSTKDGKFSFRMMKYDTKLQNATTNLSTSGLSSTIAYGMRFRNVFLYKLSNYPWSSREENAQRNTWTPAWIDADGRPKADLNTAAADAPAGTRFETDAEAIAHRDACINAWNDIQAHLQGLGYFSAWNYVPTTLSALTDRATYEAALTPAADPADKPITAAQFLPDPNSVTNYGPSAPSGFSVTADTESKGYEFELTANPLPNWRISVNASKTTAAYMNVGGALLDDFVTYMDDQMAGVAGDMRRWNGDYVSGNETRVDWANWRGQYTLLKLQEDAAASEIRKWRYNIVTNYSFTDGILKGAGIGGAYRWQDKVIIGYPVIPGEGKLASFDMSKPYYGPTEDGIDFWVSYEREIATGINWKIQLNIRNAFDNDGLIPVSIEPDGHTWATARVKPIQEWFITNTISF